MERFMSRVERCSTYTPGEAFGLVCRLSEVVNTSDSGKKLEAAEDREFESRSRLTFFFCLPVSYRSADLAADPSIEPIPSS